MTAGLAMEEVVENHQNLQEVLPVRDLLLLITMGTSFLSLRIDLLATSFLSTTSLTRFRLPQPWWVFSFAKESNGALKVRFFWVF